MIFKLQINFKHTQGKKLFLVYNFQLLQAYGLWPMLRPSTEAHAQLCMEKAKRARGEDARAIYRLIQQAQIVVVLGFTAVFD
jgi:hypothetical protein